MATTLMINPPVRDMTDTTLFSDITTSTWRTWNDNGQDFLEFTDTLTADQTRRVIWRCTLNTAQENTMLQAVQGLSAMDNIINTTGALSTTQLSNQNRTMAKAISGIIHYIIDDQ